MHSLHTPLTVTVFQYDIAWENKEENLEQIRTCMESLSGTTDLIVLPETFSTGFSMKSDLLAEPVDGPTLTLLKEWASTYRMALAGSYIAEENGSYYNRAFFLTPEGESRYADKRHLFRMGDECGHFSPGHRKVVIPYRGWNIRLLVCYDLRFPVWSRNVDNEYDLLIYVANWPSSRRSVWDTLLRARALENMSYVCGVNRIGTDGNDLPYNGGRLIYSPKGEVLASVPDNEQGVSTAALDLPALQAFREKFPTWKDADKFTIQLS